MPFTADALEHSEVTELANQLQFVTPKECLLAMRPEDLSKAVERVSGRQFRIKVSRGRSKAVAGGIARAAEAKQDDVSRRALDNADVQRFREVFGGEVRAVRDLKKGRVGYGIAGREWDAMKLPGNMQAMMKQAQQMQERMQQEIAQIKVEATAGGGMVTVKMDGSKNLLSVKIDPEVAGDVEMLQDMVLAACNEAVKKVEDESKQKMGGLLGGLGLPPGMF